MLNTKQYTFKNATIGSISLFPISSFLNYWGAFVANNEPSATDFQGAIFCVY